MRLTLRSELPFVELCVVYAGRRVLISNALVDTGAASTVVSADFVSQIGVVLEPTDPLRTLRGVGGREYVFVRRRDRVALDDRGVDGFDVEVGDMDYGFDINAIIGMDFLRATGAVIDLRALTVDLQG